MYYIWLISSYLCYIFLIVIRVYRLWLSIFTYNMYLIHEEHSFVIITSISFVKWIMIYFYHLVFRSNISSPLHFRTVKFCLTKLLSIILNANYCLPSIWFLKTKQHRILLYNTTLIISNKRKSCHTRRSLCKQNLLELLDMNTILCTIICFTKLKVPERDLSSKLIDLFLMINYWTFIKRKMKNVHICIVYLCNICK